MKTEIPQCDCCWRGARFRFPSAGEIPALRCLRHAVFYKPVFRRAVLIAAIIGTILFLINQLDVVLSGKVTALVLLKIVLTYTVPFLVSTYSALEINRLRKRSPAPNMIPPTTPEPTA